MMLKTKTPSALWIFSILLISFQIRHGVLAQKQRKTGRVVLDWNDAALDTVREERLGAFDAGRLYAMVNAAMYDAVNGGSEDKNRKATFVIKSNAMAKNTNKRAAASTAAQTVLSFMFPDRESIYEGIQQEIIDSLIVEGAKEVRINKGVLWGKLVGKEVFSRRENDGTLDKVTLPGGTGPGQFRNDFGSAAFKNMKPFFIRNPQKYISEGPPSLTSEEYLAAHTEVRLLGDANYENTEYDEIFSFWKAGGGSVRPPGEWIKITMALAEDRNVVDDLSKTLDLFTVMSLSLADTSIAVASDKVDNQFWRPATAIKEANTDGNPNTVEDSSWSPRNGSAGSSPEHTSGQSAFAGVGSTILAEFFGTDNVKFTFEGDNAISGGRTFDSFSDAAREAGRSRIFSGIHFEFSNQGGQETGREVAREFIRRLNGRIFL